MHTTLQVQAQFQSGRCQVFFPPVRSAGIKRGHKSHDGEEDDSEEQADLHFQIAVHEYFPG